jgi:hypothetical protein
VSSSLPDGAVAGHILAVSGVGGAMNNLHDVKSVVLHQCGAVTLTGSARPPCTTYRWPVTGAGSVTRIDRSAVDHDELAGDE